MKLIQPARIEWRGDQLPFATDFGDGYFSRDNGLAETQHVFIEGNQLPTRWTTLIEKEFVIGETGFGTGLNFLSAWKQWSDTAPADARLTFISAELHPLQKDDLAKVAKLWPELESLYAQLLMQYPPLTAGFHVLHFDRVTLLLLLGDASEMFSQVDIAVDVWFLDGFSPAKNPSLWTAPLLQTISRLSKPGTTAATFSAAGEVRRNLEAAGFCVHKQKGHGHKREMICAEIPTSTVATKSSINTPKDITVLGAGIAGACLAAALARKGFSVTVIDACDGPAREASGNAQAILYGKFSAQNDIYAQFNLSTYLYALRFYQQLLQAFPALPIHLCGALQLAWCDKEQRWQESLTNFFNHYPDIARSVTTAEASEIAGISLPTGGLFHGGAGWLQPAGICQHLLQHPRIQTHFSIDVSALQYADQQWHLLDAQKKCLHSSSQLVIACGHRSTQFTATEGLPLKPIRGQVSYVKPTAVSRQLKTVLSGDGYVAPACGELQSLGASYTPKKFELTINTAEHHSNLEQLGHHAPLLQQQWRAESITEGRAHFRSASPDYFPLCGPVPDRAAVLESHKALRKNANATINAAPTYLPGLYIFSNLGSRGMSYAPLCAEMLSATISGEAAPLPRDVLQALDPVRFVIRDLIKNR